VSDDETSIWMRPVRPARGPQPGYSRDTIVATAIAIADAEGLEALSMRRLAAEVGAGTMSLYRYVPKKADLYELMLDTVAGEDPLPEKPSGDWRADMRRLAHRQRSSCVRHPWAVTLAARPVFGPNILRTSEWQFAALEGLGLDIDGMLRMTYVIDAFVSGVVGAEAAERDLVRRTGIDQGQWRTALVPHIRRLIADGGFPYMTKVIVDAKTPHEGADTLFGELLDRVLDGLAATLPAD
jgi:AcrR family transcriptional regulator